MNIKESFCSIYNNHIVREGSQALLSWLLESDFFTAPARTKYHGAHEGGLVEHSLHVYNRLRRLCIAEYGEVKDMEPIAICGLLHDLCKTSFYAVSTRNVKNEKTGLWEKQPYYTVTDKFPLGHGEKSVFLIERFLRLTPKEALAIRWHMGGFDDAAKGYALTGAYEQCPLALLLHMADMMATYLDEGKTEMDGGILCWK